MVGVQPLLELISVVRGEICLQRELKGRFHRIHAGIVEVSIIPAALPTCDQSSNPPDAIAPLRKSVMSCVHNLPDLGEDNGHKRKQRQENKPGTTPSMSRFNGAMHKPVYPNGQMSPQLRDSEGSGKGIPQVSKLFANRLEIKLRMRSFICMVIQYICVNIYTYVAANSNLECQPN
jgi:hypothetical protein